MDYLYNVADLNIKCKIPFPIDIQEESYEFIKTFEETKVDIDYYYEINEVNILPSISDNMHMEGSRIYSNNDDNVYIHFCPSPGDNPYACVVWEKESKMIQCLYLEGKEEYLNYSRNILNHVGIENLLNLSNGILIHASFIKWNNKAILFCGPSGVGKSTQASLWTEYENAELINGDRAALRLTDEGWNGYGLPYAGSSGVYKNTKVPLEAIVVLEKDTENSIEKLDSISAVRYLYPEITIHRWDKDFVSINWEHCMKLLSQIPVYKLKCRIDEGAVEVLKQELTKNI